MHDELTRPPPRLWRVRHRCPALPGVPRLDAGAEAEAAHLADLKTALDALPPQRPDTAVLDAVVAAAAEATRDALGPIRTVYGEAPTPLAGPEADAEAAALAEVKGALDALPAQRPDVGLIDSVVAHAAAASGTRSPRPAPVAAATSRAADRPARRGVRRGAAVALGAVFALVLAVGIGLWPGEAPPELAEVRQAGADQTQETPTVAGDAATGAERLADATPADAADQVAAAAPIVWASATGCSDFAPSRRPDSRPSPSAASPPARAEAAPTATSEADALADAEALPLGDGDEELQLLYLRLQEMQAAQAGVEWGGPAVSLGATPDSTPAARSGWMQVRVQR